MKKTIVGLYCEIPEEEVHRLWFLPKSKHIMSSWILYGIFHRDKISVLDFVIHVTREIRLGF